MDTTRAYGDPDTSAQYERTTLAAIFADREQAHDAVKMLHDEGFHDTWVGITRSDEGVSAGYADGETRVQADNWFTRMFGEGDESLHDALVRHGVSEADARTAGTMSGAATLPAHSAIVTVDGANHPELAAQVITQAGGQMITKGFGATGYGTEGEHAWGGAKGAATTAVSPVTTGSTPLYDDAVVPLAATAPVAAANAALPAGALDVGAAQDYGSYRGGKPIDDSTRLQLREERLRIDTERRSLGEATIGKQVVTSTQEVDVPLIREELFIERRPVSASSTAAVGPITGESETISVPLTEEKLVVTKVPVVTEEVVIGKRQVEEIGHVSETTRKEVLDVKGC